MLYSCYIELVIAQEPPFKKSARSFAVDLLNAPNAWTAYSGIEAIPDGHLAERLTSQFRDVAFNTDRGHTFKPALVLIPKDPSHQHVIFVRTNELGNPVAYNGSLIDFRDVNRFSGRLLTLPSSSNSEEPLRVTPILSQSRFRSLYMQAQTGEVTDQEFSGILADVAGIHIGLPKIRAIAGEDALITQHVNINSGELTTVEAYFDGTTLAWEAFVSVPMQEYDVDSILLESAPIQSVSPRSINIGRVPLYQQHREFEAGLRSWVEMKTQGSGPALNSDYGFTKPIKEKRRPWQDFAFGTQLEISDRSGNWFVLRLTGQPLKRNEAIVQHMGSFQAEGKLVTILLGLGMSPRALKNEITLLRTSPSDSLLWDPVLGAGEVYFSTSKVRSTEDRLLQIHVDAINCRSSVTYTYDLERGWLLFPERASFALQM